MRFIKVRSTINWKDLVMEFKIKMVNSHTKANFKTVNTMAKVNIKNISNYNINCWFQKEWNI